MTIIATTDALAAACRELAELPYLTVDTEFMRESTFWPKLCLVQIAGDRNTAIIDPLAPGIRLDPLLELMRAPDTLKVFHAARQDVEIFFHLGGVIPAPLFDTQIAAMVCGFGDSVSYETLAARLAQARLDKTARFTNWARRPLSARQLSYARDDVVHLRTVYEKLKRRLAASERAGWLDEEMAVLCDPATYAIQRDEAWRRIKTRATEPRLLAVLQEVAAWREDEAQTRNTPRNWVAKDEALIEIAGDPPRDEAGLKRIRALPRGFGPHGAAGLLAAVSRGLDRPEDDLPRIERARSLPRGLGPLIDLLKVLLKTKCEASEVAQKLVASTADLERIAADDHADVAALNGWRRELFGRDALALKHGKLALAAGNREVKVIRLDKRASR